MKGNDRLLRNTVILWNQ